MAKKNNSPLVCKDCGNLYGNDSGFTLTALRKLAKQDGWMTNVPAWACGRPDSPKRMAGRNVTWDFCKACDEKIGQRAMDSVAKLRSDPDPFNKPMLTGRVQ